MTDMLRTKYLSDEESDFIAISHPEILDPKFCPTCNGDGYFSYRYKRPRKCDCELQCQLYRHYLAAGIPAAYMRLDWGDFKGSSSVKQAAVEYASKHQQYIDSSIGLMLTGDNGIGKTLILTLLLKDMLKRGYKGFFTTADDLFAMKTDGWTDDMEKKRFEKKVKNSKILVIDDAGKEFANRLTKQVFDSLVRYRSQNALTTLISSNKHLKELGAEYGQSFVSLIKGGYIVQEVDGKDYREQALQIRLGEIDKGWTRPIA